MITENEIRNQIAITETLLITLKDIGDDEYYEAEGYHKALKYVIGESKAKFDKEDI